MPGTASPHPRRWWALGLLAAAQFMVIMDTSIIGVALPEIQRALGFSQSGLSWIFNAYVVAFGGLLLLGGRLSDPLGARRVFAAGWVVLTGASVLAGLAGTAESPDRGACAPGRRCRADRPLGARVLAGLVRPRAARADEGVRDSLRRRRSRRRHCRGVPRRRPHGVGRLALGLPAERPDRPRRAGRDRPPASRGRRPPRAHRPRRGRRHHRRDIAGRPRDRPHPGGRLDVAGDPGRARRRRGAAGLVHGPAGRPPRAARAAVDLPRAGARAGQRGDRAPRGRLDPDVVLPQPLPAAGARASGRSRPAPRCSP